jgi:acetate kinase
VLDPGANAASRQLISTEDSRVAVFVIPTDEELMIARHALKLVSAHRQPSLAERTVA